MPGTLTQQRIQVPGYCAAATHRFTRTRVGNSFFKLIIFIQNTVHPHTRGEFTATADERCRKYERIDKKNIPEKHKFLRNKSGTNKTSRKYVE
ncbi:hypothetical protein MmiAt1_17340 [Methanimicrococcus sp. At1]|uniref:Uncharacterized protein n=1 Tax=Methanimicrococcus hacksteinii TaxID=3028293 RepID=A0ABU3VRS9_9EURY|nr:hypothetical protein [Methanimicrococcus sp. At1]